jgi:hypothetical protein
MVRSVSLLVDSTLGLSVGNGKEGQDESARERTMRNANKHFRKEDQAEQAACLAGIS